jgi:hypothetical protein
MSFSPKRHSFANFRILVFLLFLFLIFFKNRNFFFFLKKKGNRGGSSNPLPKNGVVRPPHFWPRGDWSHPLRPVWGGQSQSQALRGGPATPKGKKKKKKKMKEWVWPLRVAGPPLRAWDWLWPPLTGRRGWLQSPLGQKWGGPTTPFLGRGLLEPPRFPFFFFFFFF